MGNRHHHKKMRAAVRAAMARTGESYQQTLSRLRREKTDRSAPGRDVDLIPIDYFGFPAMLATFEILEGLSCIVTPGSHLPEPCPKSPFFALARQRNLS
jgi:hypothetical protein